jgi:hypothetical protein
MKNSTTLPDRQNTSQKQPPRPFIPLKALALIFGILLIALALVTGLYLMGSRKPWAILPSQLSLSPQTTVTQLLPPNPSPTPTQTMVTMNWITYHNPNAGYFISLPRTFIRVQSAGVDAYVQGEKTICCDFSGPNLVISYGLVKENGIKQDWILIDGVQAPVMVSPLEGILIGPFQKFSQTYYITYWAKDVVFKHIPENLRSYLATMRLENH